MVIWEPVRWRDTMAYRAGGGPGEGVQLGEQVRRLCCPDLPEYLQCLAQQDPACVAWSAARAQRPRPASA